ncbi:MAG: AraC family transcriptional regulator [Bacteroidales bacterium]|nr:AraC family transcriptional regulator [Bacteroidales bacterium]
MEVSVVVSTYIVYTCIIVSLVAALVRAFHICPECRKDPDFFYPSRFQLVFFFASAILYLPYVIHPMSEDARLSVCLIPVLLYPITASLLIERFFITRKIDVSFVETYWMTSFPNILILLITVFAFKGGDSLSRYSLYLKLAVWITSFFMLLRLGTVLRYMFIRMRNYKDDNHPENLKRVQRNVSILTITMSFIFVLMTIGYNPVVVCILFSMMMVIALVLLLVFLSPQIKADEKVINRQKKLDISSFIESKAYCEKGINLQTLAAKFCTNAKYMSQHINSEYGTDFRSFISKLRLDEAKSLLLEDGGTRTLEDVAISIGLDGASSLVRLFNKLEGTTPNKWRNAQLNLDNSTNGGGRRRNT